MEVVEDKFDGRLLMFQLWDAVGKGASRAEGESLLCFWHVIARPIAAAEQHTRYVGGKIVIAGGEKRCEKIGDVDGREVVRHGGISFDRRSCPSNGCLRLSKYLRTCWRDPSTNVDLGKSDDEDGHGECELGGNHRHARLDAYEHESYESPDANQKTDDRAKEKAIAITRGSHEFGSIEIACALGEDDTEPVVVLSDVSSVRAEFLHVCAAGAWG